VTEGYRSCLKQEAPIGIKGPRGKVQRFPCAENLLFGQFYFIGGMNYD